MTKAPAGIIGGRYRLTRQLGQGGMGTVWEGHDDVLDRPVAVKEVTLPPGLGDAQRAELIERATREARTAARVSHRAIIAIHDVVQQDGRPWIVMELVASRSLDRIIAQDGPLPAPRAAAIAREVLSALMTAHAAGIVHRDVKPANILVGHDGRVVLTDFGIATFEGDPALTRTGMVNGSPSYIAPERVNGMQAGPASDLWSLGASLYAMVTGRSPFHRDSAMAVLAALISKEDADLAQVPPALRLVLGGLLTKDPARRMNGEEADRLLAQVESSERTVPATGRGSNRQPKRGVRTGLMIGATVVLVAAAAGGWTLLQGEGKGPATAKQPGANVPASTQAARGRSLRLQKQTLPGGWTVKTPKTWTDLPVNSSDRTWADPKGRAVLKVQVDLDPQDQDSAASATFLYFEDELKRTLGQKYRRIRLEDLPVDAGSASEFEFLGYNTTASEEDVTGAYRELDHVVAVGSTTFSLTWKVRKEYWSIFAPTMRAVLESLSPPA